MKPFGLLMMIAGLAIAIYFGFAFDVSVKTDDRLANGQIFPGERVVNLGLLSERQSGVIIAGAMAIVGTILFVVPAQKRARIQTVRGGKVCPDCGLISPETATSCDCGRSLVADGTVLSRSAGA